jgi:hypothetical protein
LISFCEAPLNNFVNKQGCVHHFDAEAGDFNLHFKNNLRTYLILPLAAETLYMGFELVVNVIT